MASQLNQDEVITQAYYLINNKGDRRAEGIRARAELSISTAAAENVFCICIYFVFKIYSYQ